MTRSEEIAWAAGLFEGEGCIAALRFARRTSICLVLSTTDRDVIDRFVRIVGVGGVRLKPRPDKPAHYKDLWEWRIADRAEVQATLDLLWDWLGERRQETANDIMDEVTPLQSEAVA